MAWYNSAWRFRKKLTIPAASVTGSGALTAFPLTVVLGSDSDVVAGAHRTGKDILFTSSDGTTKIPHDLIPKQQWLSRRGATIWFTWPQACHSTSANKTWFGLLQGTGASGSDGSIGEYDHTSGAYTRTIVYNPSKDDHNNPSIICRSTDGKLVTAYCAHNDSVIRWRLSTNANDSTAWGTEQTADPFTGLGGYSYASVMELPSLNLLIMFVRAGQSKWGYAYSSNSGTPSWTWVNFQDTTFDASRIKLYWRWKVTGAGRLDIAGCLDPFSYTNALGTAGAFTVFHAYFDGDWHKTDGTTMSTGHPSSPFVKADFTAVYASGASDNAWVEDVDVDASGKPRISFPVYPGAVATDQRLYVASWSGSAWSTQNLGLSGTGPEPTTSDVYTGCTSFVCGNAADLYVGWMASGVYEIQLWRESGGTYAKVDDITSGSDEHQFRPCTVYGAAAGKPAVMWMAGNYASFSTYETGLRCYPAMGSYYHTAIVKADISGAADTDIYLYYGNTSNVAPQIDAANAYNSSYVSVLRQSRWLDKADPFKVYDHKGVQSNVAIADLCLEPTQLEGPYGEGWSHSNTKTATACAGFRMSGLNLASVGAATWQATVRATFASGSPQGIMGSDTAQNGADILYRINASSPNVTAYAIGQNNAVLGGSPFNAGITPTTNTWQHHSLVFDGTAKTLKARVASTEGTLATGFGSATLDDGATKTMYYGLSGPATNPLYGYETEIRISNVALSKDWTDTEDDAAGAGIVTFGAAESLRGAASQVVGQAVKRAAGF